jgi:hypothetical protein
MNIGKENDIVYALTAPPSDDDTQRDLALAALVDYLRQGKAFHYLLNSLADLLDKNGNSVWELRLLRRDNRYVDSADAVERKVRAFQRAQELTGLIADRPLLDLIARTLQQKWHNSAWKVAPRKTQWLIQENGMTICNVPAEKPMNEATAKKIAAAEYGFTYGTFRDIYRDIERAMRVE